jgi:hypothetical protein
MAQFTQLNLSGNPDRKPEAKPTRNISSTNQHPRFDAKKLSVGHKAAALVGSLMVASLLGVFLLGTSGCSKKETGKDVALSQNQPVSPASITPNSLSPTAPAESQPPAPKKSARKSGKRRSFTVTYTNRTYGVSFQYPRSYILKTGDEAILHWTASEPVLMNFVQSGGLAVAAIEPPRGSYPATDFASAFLNVSVNPNLTSSQCAQFAFPKPSDASVGPVSPAKVTVGGIDFDEMEDTTKQVDARYYHVFTNALCYEFGLGLATAPDAAKEGVTPVSSQEVLSKLEKILSTVKIQERPVEAGVGPTVQAGQAPAPIVVVRPVHPADGSKD